MEGRKLAHDGKSRWSWRSLWAGLGRAGFCALIAAYLVSEGRVESGLENTAHTLLGVEVPLQDEKGKQGRSSLPTGWTEADLATAGGRRTAAILNSIRY